MKHTLSGTMTGNTIAGVRVEAGDSTSIVDDLIDVAISDTHGRFTMEVDEDCVAAVFSGDRRRRSARVSEH